MQSRDHQSGSHNGKSKEKCPFCKEQKKRPLVTYIRKRQNKKHNESICEEEEEEEEEIEEVVSGSNDDSQQKNDKDTLLKSQWFIEEGRRERFESCSDRRLRDKFIYIVIIFTRLYFYNNKIQRRNINGLCVGGKWAIVEDLSYNDWMAYLLDSRHDQDTIFTLGKPYLFPKCIFATIQDGLVECIKSTK